MLCTTWHIFAEDSESGEPLGTLFAETSENYAPLGTYSLRSPNILREACETFATDGTACVRTGAVVTVCDTRANTVFDDRVFLFCLLCSWFNYEVFVACCFHRDHDSN